MTINLDVLISIVIPCYNTGAYVEEAIKSALAQTHARIEVIVIDDGSTDDSWIRIGQFTGITKIQQQNMGVSKARNAGLAVARGDYVVFLDADDCLKPDALKHHLSGFRKTAVAALVFGSCDYVDQRGVFLERRSQPERVYHYWDVLDGMTPTPTQCMFHRSTLASIGGFNASLKGAEDYDCYLHLSRAGKVSCHGEIVACYRKHSGQATRNPSRMLDEILSVVESHRRLYATCESDNKKFDAAARLWKRRIGKWIPSEAVRQMRKFQGQKAGSSLLVFSRNLPHSALDFVPYLMSVIQKRRV